MRAYTCHLVQGNLEQAKVSIEKAIELGEANQDKNKFVVAELIKYEGFGYAALEKKEYRESTFYAGKILEQCTDSMKHYALKIESIVSHSPADMSDAIRFTTSLQERFIDNSLFLFWRGRILLYSGQTDMAKKYLQQALSIDPDNDLYKKFRKNNKTMEKVKTEAGEEFKAQSFEAAIYKYSECLAFDPLNSEYNQAVLYNRACAYNRLGQNDKAIADLDTAIKHNPEYVKAFFKKGDIKLDMKLYDEAMHEYSKVKEFNPGAPGLREKLRHAQIELKKSKRKDLYKLLGVDPGAGETMIKKAYRK